MGSRTVCFIDKKGMAGICIVEGLSSEQIREIMGSLSINCKKCGFYKKYKGKEREHFSYTAWGYNEKEKETKEKLLDAISLIENTAQNEGWDWIEAYARDLREELEEKLGEDENEE